MRFIHIMIYLRYVSALKWVRECIVSGVCTSWRINMNWQRKIDCVWVRVSECTIYMHCKTLFDFAYGANQFLVRIHFFGLSHTTKAATNVTKRITKRIESNRFRFKQINCVCVCSRFWRCFDLYIWTEPFSFIFIQFTPVVALQRKCNWHSFPGTSLLRCWCWCCCFKHTCN